MHYDFAISCREPILNVSGGIGTYTRELLNTLSRRGITCTLFIPSESSEIKEINKIFPSLHIRLVQDTSTRPNNLNQETLQWSYALYTEIKRFLENHSISVFEFPDYEAEGFFAINAAHHGIIKLRTAVRLHSPIFMLADDNNEKTFSLTKEKTKAAEFSCLRLCNHILFGADAMKERVFSYFSQSERKLLEQKSVKIYHPHKITNDPTPIARTVASASTSSRPITIATIGRLEYRKGQDLLLEGMKQLPNATNLQIVLFGGDTHTAPNLSSFRSYVLGLAKSRELETHIKVSGKLTQTELWSKIKSGAEGFIFPSRFENYPNALLETIHLNRPTAVSSQGGMPEILELSRHNCWIKFDPTPKGVRYALEWLHSSVTNPPSHDPEHSAPLTQEASIEPSIQDEYEKLARANQQDNLQSKQKPCRTIDITIITPHKNQSRYIDPLLDSVAKSRALGLSIEFIVIDDNSEPDEYDDLKEKIHTNNTTHLIQARELGIDGNGPSQLRDYGLSIAQGEYVFFCDADDYFLPDFLASAVETLDKNVHIHYCITPHRAFGSESYIWMPNPATKLSAICENYTNCGLFIRKKSLSGDEFSHHYPVSEDWFSACKLLINELNFSIYCEPGYFYRRGNPTRSTRNPELGSAVEAEIKKDLINELLKSTRNSLEDIAPLIHRAIFSPNDHGYGYIPPNAYNAYLKILKATRALGIKPIISRLLSKIPH